MFDAKRAFALLEKLSFTRMAGTPEELRAANILMDEIRAMGLTPELESFTVPDGTVTRATFEVLEPYQATYEVTGFKCCENTPEEGVTADFLYVQDCSEAALRQARGKIVLINGLPRLPVYRKLLQAGVSGILTVSGTLFDHPENEDLGTRKIRQTLSSFGLLPAATLRMKDALELVTREASRVRLCVVGETADLVSHNVMVTLPGTEYPEEIVSFGAHYDSVQFSTGAYDNAAGSAVLMELLRHYAANPSKRTLRFNWYGAEEVGLEGSKAFLRLHADELPRHRMMFNFDVAGPVLGQDCAKVCGDMAVVHAADAFMKLRGYMTNVFQGTQSSDSMPFADQGIPAINFVRYAEPGAGVMHNRNDIIDYLSPAALARTGIPALDFCSLVTEAVVFPFERIIPSELVPTIENYFFKKELAELNNK